MSEKSNWKQFVNLKPTKKSLEKRAAKVEKTTLKHARKFLLNRWDNLREARREVVGWLLLVAVLIGIGALQMISYSSGYQTTAAISGGTYAEGVVGKIANINPLYAETDSEKAASRLVYDSLLTYDTTNSLSGDLAMSWKMSEDGTTYDVTLKPGIKWQDGEPLTADDVVFTVNTIRDPKTGSILYDSWRTITAEKVSESVVRFTLQAPFTPFPHALTFGVLPKHVLGDVQPSSMREYVSSNRVVGSGPYILRSTQLVDNDQASLTFTANESYFRRAPRIKTVQMRTYADSAALKKGFSVGEVNAAVGLSVADATATTDNNNAAKMTQVSLDDGVFALFNMAGPITGDQTVRKALREGLDRAEVRKAVVVGNASEPSELDGPLVQGIYQSVDAQKQPKVNKEEAAKLLDGDGWVVSKDGVRVKDGQKLKLSMVTVQGTDYEPAAKDIADQWRKLGVDVELTVASQENVQQNYFIPRNYDVLVYQLQLGADSDVFAYWHSSQASARGLNFANYKSTLSDALLVSGRTRTSSDLREAKYKTFVETWLEDVPAIALYKPDLYYVAADNINSLDGSALVNTSYRFRDVYDWTAKIGTVNSTP